MDRRQKKTREAIFAAFTKILSLKGYNSITVQEIIDEANIGRSTFYSHFETKDDLLKALCGEIFDHVFSENLTKENTHDFSGTEAGLKGKITHILYHLQDSSPYIKQILSCANGDLFMNYFKEYLKKTFEPELKKTYTKVPQDYLLNHTICDFAETVKWWMKNDKYSPEEISSFFLSTTPFQ